MNHLQPGEILASLTEIGVNKAKSPARKLVLLGIMAGAFIAFAGAASTMGAFNLLAAPETFGLGRILCGAIFTGGLVMVTLAGAELFTGNTLIAIAVIDKRARLTEMLRNWLIVYIANFVGSILVAWLVYNSGILGGGDGLLGAVTVKIAAGKVNMTFMQHLTSGILCNWLVCLAVWCAAGAPATAGKVLAVFFPIWLFATCGFEHCIANMYFISAGIFAAANEAFVSASGAASEALAALDFGSMFLRNLLPVTLGNIIGGLLMVACGYRFALKK